MRWIAAFGCAHDGRLGISTLPNDAAEVRAPTLVDFFHDVDAVGEILSIHVGGFHTFVRTTKGVYGYGLNDEGQLGTGEKTPSYRKPVKIEWFGSGADVFDIACGTSHTVCWTREGLFACGSNEFGQLGLGDTDSRTSFSKITLAPFLSEATDPVGNILAPESSSIITHVSCGTFHTLVAVKNVVLPVPTNDTSASTNQAEEVAFYPAALFACGKGDYGELGYNHDSWDLLAAQERRIKDAVRNRAKYGDMGGDVAECASSTCPGVTDDAALPAALEGSAVVKKPPVFKCKAKKQRRPPFFHPLLKMVCVAELEKQAADFQNLGTNDSTILTRTHIVDIRAMHLHSSVTLITDAVDPCDRRISTYQFGCLYCNEIEGLETSIPTLVVHPQHQDSLPSLLCRIKLLAADEMMLMYVDAPGDSFVPDRGTVLVKGKGAIGLGADDSFEPQYRPLAFPTLESSGKRLSRVLSVAGRTHVVVWGADETGEDVVYGFGDNLFGQLGTAEEYHGDREKVLSPVRILRAGDRLESHVAGVRGSRPPPVAPLSITVRRVVDVACGARHTVVLFED